MDDTEACEVRTDRLEEDRLCRQADGQGDGGNCRQGDSGIYRQETEVRASDCDMYQRIRLSVLFRFLQEISIAHTEALGYPRETTLDKGALWVISRMKIGMKRPVLYSEHLVLESWPGDMMHILFPRYYRISVRHGDGSLEHIGGGSAIWMLIDAGNRKWIFPEMLGIRIPGTNVPDAPELPAELVPFEAEGSENRKARYSELDLNGHVNNTRYLDWMDDLIDDDFYQTHFVRSVQVNFYQEIHGGQDVRLRYRKEPQLLCVEGIIDDRRMFALRCEIGEMPAR